MDDDYIDDDGNIWIYKVMAAALPPGDPRHLTPAMRHRLVEHRLAQMQREAERNVETLRAVEFSKVEMRGTRRGVHPTSGSCRPH